MHIAVLNQFYAPKRFGGAEVSVQMLCEALVARGNEVTLITGSGYDAREQETINGVNVRRIMCGNFYNWTGQKYPAALRAMWHGIDTWNPHSFRQVSRALREVKPNILHTNNLAGFSSSAWSAAQSLGVPVAHTLRDYYLLCPRSTMFHRRSNCIRQCASCHLMSVPKRLASRTVSGVVGISRFLLRRHQQAGLFTNAQVAQVIPNPAPLVQKDREIQFNEKEHALGFLGRLEPAKGIEFLLKTLVDHNFCGWSKVLVGGSGAEDYEKILRQKYNDSRIIFAGYVDPASFFKRVHLLVVPSLWNEPFGRVVIEAFAYGVPVVASNRGGLKELVKEGTNGFTFNPDLGCSLKDLLFRLASQGGLLKELQCGARAKVIFFSPENVATAYEEFFTKVIEKRSVSL